MLEKAYLLVLMGLAVHLNMLREINATVGLFAPDRYDGVPEACLLPMDFGYCRAKVKRYYFDMRRMKCAMFFWGGCAGNINNFKSMEECNRQCLDPYSELNGGNIYEGRGHNEQKYIALSADNSGRNNHHKNKSSSEIVNNRNNNNNSNNAGNKTIILQNNSQPTNPTANYANTNAAFSLNYNNNNNNNKYNIDNKPSKYLFNNNLRKSFTLTKHQQQPQQQQQQQSQEEDNNHNNHRDTSSAEKIYDDDYEN